MTISMIEQSKLGVLLIDVQPLFWDLAFRDRPVEGEALMVRVEHLLMFCQWMDLPLIATFEQPVAENGELPARLEAVCPGEAGRYTKNSYDCTSEPAIREAIKRLPVSQFAVAGAETDVCVMQSVVGLREMGYDVYLLEDCLFTSEPHPGPALRRLAQAGVVPCTLKMLLYEVVRSVDRSPWYPDTWIERDRTYAKPFPEAFKPPETWPAWAPVC